MRPSNPLVFQKSRLPGRRSAFLAWTRSSSSWTPSIEAPGFSRTIIWEYSVPRSLSPRWAGVKANGTQAWVLGLGK